MLPSPGAIVNNLGLQLIMILGMVIQTKFKGCDQQHFSMYRYILTYSDVNILLYCMQHHTNVFDTTIKFF